MKPASEKQLRYIRYLSNRVGSCPVFLGDKLTALEASWAIDGLRKKLAESGMAALADAKAQSEARIRKGNNRCQGPKIVLFEYIQDFDLL